jgi:hypothetical protein
MSLPIIKFISNVASYAAFIGLIIGSSLEFAATENNKHTFSYYFPAYVENFTAYVNSSLTYKFDVPDFYIRSNEPTNLEILICIWIVGLIINDLKYIYLNGVQNYFLSWNNVLNSVIFAMLISAYGLKFYTMIIVTIEKKRLYDASFWLNVVNVNASDLATQQDIFSTFYWLNNGMLIENSRHNKRFSF